MNLASLLALIPPEAWSAIITAVLTLVITNLHLNGTQFPILSAILNAFLKPKAPTPPPSPGPDTVSVPHPILDAILKVLQAAQPKAPPAA